MNNEREIMTFTGKMFDFYDPGPATICIEDIAHALALTNRYGGHTREPYSVAEHSVRCSYVTMGDPLLNLMHDAAEAYINDIPRPQKQGLGWCLDVGSLISDTNSYRQVESDILYAIFEKLRIAFPVNFPDGVTKQVDNILMATEVRDLMPPQSVEKFGDWIKDIKPLKMEIVPWPWDRAEREFLKRYGELTQ